MPEQTTSNEDYRARAGMLRILDAFGSNNPAALPTALDAVMKTGDQHVREVFSYLAGTTFGLFIAVHGLEPTRAIIARELEAAEDLAGL
jgi:hypothetical protein